MSGSNGLTVGELVGGKYRIGALIGEGGFATVYAATDERMGRRVALKVLRPDDERGGYLPATRARVQRELEVLALLTDPHTIRLFDHGVTVVGLIYMVFEYLPGADLSAVLEARGVLPAEVVTHILRQLLSSLGEAHRAGLLHRDLKPSNVRVYEYAGDPWCVKLLDFGIARAVAVSATITSTGELVGTPRYMSPEQLTERPLNPASDIYSLGLVALEMLKGRDALAGERFGDQLGRLRADHAFDAPVEDAALGPVIAKMTAREPADRFQSAEAVLAALAAPVPPRALTRPATPAAVAPGVRLTSPGSPPSAAPSGWGRRLGVAALIVLLCAAAAVAVFAGVDEPESPAPVRGQHRDLPGRLLRGGAIAAPVDASASGDAGTRADAGVGVEARGGCGRKPPFLGSQKMYAYRDPRKAPWLVHIPAGYDPSVRYPLMILLHDDGENETSMLEVTAFDELADEHGFVVYAASDQMIDPWDEPKAELPRLQARVAEISAQLCIDEARIFAVGQGTGGEMAQHLGCEPWIAGFVTNSFRGNPARELARCEHRAAYLMFVPTDSGHVPLAGGKNCRGRDRRSHDEAVEWWTRRNGCAGRGELAFTEHDGATCTNWDCEVPLAACVVEGGHGWPGSPRRVTDLLGCDGKPPSFATSEVAWEFLSALETDRRTEVDAGSGDAGPSGD